MYPAKMRRWTLIFAFLLALTCLVQSQQLQQEDNLKEHIDYLAKVDPMGLESLKQEIDYALMKYNFQRPAR